MTVALKELSGQAREVSSGVVSLKAGSEMVKKSLLCRTGKFDGMYGEVTVSKELLEGIAELYNRVKAQAQNENDYAPILVDHVREVDLIKGRVLPDLSVQPWTDPVTGKEESGLYGSLRIDDAEAQQKVEDGKYAHLSISFDEDTFELFETSFVAVEAARGSIVLSKGGSMELEVKLNKALQKHSALAAAVKDARAKRKAKLLKMKAERLGLVKECDALMALAKEVSLSVKAAQLKGKFSEFIKLGKMNPSELKSMDFKELATLSEGGVKILLSSYEARPVSKDVHQYGQSGADQKKMATDLSPEKMREAIALQKAGKGVSLAADEEPDDEEMKKLAGEEEKPEEKEMKSYSMAEEEYQKCLEEISGVHSKLSEVVEKIKGMGGAVDEMAEGEEDDEKKEMAAEGEEEKESKEGEE